MAARTPIRWRAPTSSRASSAASRSGRARVELRRVAGGISALPTDGNAALNAFFLTVEPQIDITSPEYHWKLGLGAPLQFELVDSRGAFEVCVSEARAMRAKGSTQSQLSSAAATCVTRQRGRATENFGRLRRADWDSASDFAKIIKYFVVGGQEQPFYLSFSRLYDQSFGHGTVVRHYNPNIDYNTARLGANLDFNKSAVGIQAMANDMVSPDVLGLMSFVRPFRPFSDGIVARSLSLGLSWMHGVNQPTMLRYERGLFGPGFDQPLPQVDPNLRLISARARQTSIVGVDLEAKIVRSNWADVKVYADYQKMVSYGGGTTLGSLFRLSFGQKGQPATQALRARAEVTEFSPDYLPSYFDTFHDIFQYQYLPAAYTASNGLRYYPTKLEYLEASRGGRRRIGGYVELAYSVLDRMTVGATLRGWQPYGDPGQAGFGGPKLPDYGSVCKEGENGALVCDKTIDSHHEPGFGSLRLHAELPFRKYLQAFASYEAFSTTAEKGLGAFRFNGDNEVFFWGARLMLLPIFFIQAEARRYFFLQRLSDIDTAALSFKQDQNFHSRWTFAINASVGYEF